MKLLSLMVMFVLLAGCEPKTMPEDGPSACARQLDQCRLDVQVCRNANNAGGQS